VHCNVQTSQYNTKSILKHSVYKCFPHVVVYRSQDSVERHKPDSVVSYQDTILPEADDHMCRACLIWMLYLDYSSFWMYKLTCI